jgi:putative acyl-CoA dehydrogenase
MDNARRTTSGEAGNGGIWATHEVLNQPPPFQNVDLFALDAPLREAVAANGGAASAAELSAFGKQWGDASMFARGQAANVHSPILETFDAQGYRRDRVAFHPAYHELMAASMAAGLHASTWGANGAPAPAPSQVVRAAKFYMAAQVEGGHLCPITMTRAAVAALHAQPDVLARVMPKVASRTYDPRFCSWSEKQSMTLGMGMTEKQGGTDVRANTSRALRDGDAWRITGHKWFMSAPMCDAFLVLAQASGGLTCFFMPRFTPDGSVNALHFQRLKDKMGNRSNASSEVEFRDAYALQVGEEGRGVRTIIQMVQLTRQDCAISSAGMMRMGLAQALHHARHRTVFQKHLVDQPLMRRVLADMALHVEAATALVMRLCRSFDLSGSIESEAARMRMLTPVAKYWICKSAPGFLYEAMECLGGNGYVETGLMARLYREAPVNAIWEGSGNVMCLDVLRAIAKEPEAARALLAQLAQETRDFPHAQAQLHGIAKRLAAHDAESEARRIVESIAQLAALAALAESASPAAAIFASNTFDGARGTMWGAASYTKADEDALQARVLPD